MLSERYLDRERESAVMDNYDTCDGYSNDGPCDHCEAAKANPQSFAIGSAGIIRGGTTDRLAFFTATAGILR